VEDWSEESYQIAITKYDGLKIGEALPSEYIEENLIVAQQ